MYSCLCQVLLSNVAFAVITSIRASSNVDGRVIWDGLCLGLDMERQDASCIASGLSLSVAIVRAMARSVREVLGM